jgi:hypothetical protein
MVEPIRDITLEFTQGDHHLAALGWRSSPQGHTAGSRPGGQPGSTGRRTRWPCPSSGCCAGFGTRSRRRAGSIHRYSSRTRGPLHRSIATVTEQRFSPLASLGPSGPKTHWHAPENLWSPKVGARKRDPIGTADPAIRSHAYPVVAASAHPPRGSKSVRMCRAAAPRDGPLCPAPKTADSGLRPQP